MYVGLQLAAAKLQRIYVLILKGFGLCQQPTAAGGVIFARSRINAGAGGGTCPAFVTDSSGRIADRDFRLIKSLLRAVESEAK